MSFLGKGRQCPCNLSPAPHQAHIIPWSKRLNRYECTEHGLDCKSGAGLTSYMSLPASPQQQDHQEKNIAAGVQPVEVLLD